MPHPKGTIPGPQRRKLIAADRRARAAVAALHTAVAEAHAAGGSIRVIADLLGRSTHTIQAWLRAERERNTDSAPQRRSASLP